jgi:hypothetical protein
LSQKKNLKSILKLKLHKVCIDFEQAIWVREEGALIQWLCYSILGNIQRQNLHMDISEIFDTTEDGILAEAQERILKCEMTHNFFFFSTWISDLREGVLYVKNKLASNKKDLEKNLIELQAQIQQVSDGKQVQTAQD